MSDNICHYKILSKRITIKVDYDQILMIKWCIKSNLVSLKCIKILNSHRPDVNVLDSVLLKSCFVVEYD